MSCIAALPKPGTVAGQIRERLLIHGAGRLSDQELLFALFDTGCREDTVFASAQRILQDHEGRCLLEALPEELSKYQGISEANSCRLKAALELAKRLLFASKEPRPMITKPQEAADLVQSDIGFLDREAIKVINLNTANLVIAIEDVSIGGLAAASVHPREVFKGALKRSAAAIILAHNHPSGELKPSNRDIEETRKLMLAGEILGIPLCDHIIVSHGRHLSMLEAGHMQKAVPEKK